MDELIALIQKFISDYGFAYTLIAVLGILVLAILKYTNCFSKLDKQVRHIIYLAISVGLSVIGSIVYMLIAGTFDANAIVYMSMAIFALNQAWYAIISNTGLKDLIKIILDKISNLIPSDKKE